MHLQVGKTYLTRDGKSVAIVSQHEVSGPFAMLGKMVEEGTLLYYYPSGRHGKKETPADLVREAGAEPAPMPTKPGSMMSILEAAVSEAHAD
jgi:hypothetical protein